MADSDKNIHIHPRRGHSEKPRIDFTGYDNNTVSLYVLDDGTLSFEGSSGQLFSISDSLTGTIFSVNDVSGIPSLEVEDDGTVTIAEFAGDVVIGAPDTSQSRKVYIDGDLSQQGNIYLENGYIEGATQFKIGTTTVIDTDAKIDADRIKNDGSGSGLDADTLDGQHASAFASSGHNHDSIYVKKTSSQALSSATNAMTISGHTITLNRGDGTTDTVTVPDNNTNTWRGIQDNLTSTSTTESLSANQGKTLKGLVDDVLDDPTLTGEVKLRPDAGTMQGGTVDIYPDSGQWFDDGGAINLMGGQVSSGSGYWDTGKIYLHEHDMHFEVGGYHPKFIFNDEVEIQGGTAWHSGNDGSGSGLDADTVDGQHASAFSSSGHNHDSTYVKKDSDGNVGIGTTSPYPYKLDVQGNYSGSILRVKRTTTDQGDSGAVVRIELGENTGPEDDPFIEFWNYGSAFGPGRQGSIMTAQGDNGIRFVSNDVFTFNTPNAATEVVRITNNGDLHVDGDVVAHSTTVSDERLKENIVGIDNALNKVKQINGYTFSYKEDGKISAGVIAQEVEKVLPESVSEKELPLNCNDGQEYKVLNYDALHALSIEAIKEQQKEIDELKTLVKQLMEKI